MYVSPNYEINLFIQLIANVIGFIIQVSITLFFILLTGYIEAQTLALSNELGNLWDDAIEHYKGNRYIESRVINTEEERKIVNIYVKKNLENIIRIHTNNLNLYRQVEYIFRNPIAIEFTLIIIGLTAELLGALENVWLTVPYALIIMGTNCLIGQKFIDASMTFEHVVYDSKWENFDGTNRKIVLLMLLNSQKTMKLSAGGVTTMSLESFMSIVKVIYSVHTALRSTVK